MNLSKLSEDDKPLPKKPSVVCAWCKKLMKQGDPIMMVSHGICEKCAEEMLKS